LGHGRLSASGAAADADNKLDVTPKKMERLVVGFIID
jgi:hypothetical protein